MPLKVAVNLLSSGATKSLNIEPTGIHDNRHPYDAWDYCVPIAAGQDDSGAPGWCRPRKPWPGHSLEHPHVGIANFDKALPTLEMAGQCPHVLLEDLDEAAGGKVPQRDPGQLLGLVPKEVAVLEVQVLGQHREAVRVGVVADVAILGAGALEDAVHMHGLVAMALEEPLHLEGDVYVAKNLEAAHAAKGLVLPETSSLA